MRKPFWLIGSVAALGAATWIMSAHDRKGSGANTSVEQVQVQFPSHHDAHSYQRMRERTTLAWPQSSASATSSVQGLPAPGRMLPPSMHANTPMAAHDGVSGATRDPFLFALPPQAEIALVFEASVLREVPVGKLLMGCLASQGAGADPWQMLGVDLAKEVDRVAVTDSLFVLSGHFPADRWAPTTDAGNERPYGQGGRFRSRDAVDREGMALATYGSDIVLVAADPKVIEAAIDRIEGPLSAEAPPPIVPALTYGEVYGFVRAERLADLLPPEIGFKFREAAKTVEVHVDARHDVLVVADVTGPDANRVTDLGRALAGVLSVARVKAQSEGNADLSRLLDESRVSLRPREFRVEVGLPAALVAKQLGACANAGLPALPN